MALAKDKKYAPTFEYSRVFSRHLDKKNGKPVAVILQVNGHHHIAPQRRFLPVSKGDMVKFVNGNGWVKLRKMEGEIQVVPAWSIKTSLTINGKKIPLIVKEIETQEELNAYEDLTQFHYRGNGGVGRRTPLVAKLDVWNLPKIAGFVELSSSMLVNVARKKILDQPFQDKKLQIQWERWDLETSKQFNNVIVRISRCVVYPELRGLGLATELTGAAVKYARERWHIGGLRPCFIEIVAEMLRYWPFVEKNGFIKVGETEGNGHRVQKTMAYLLNRKENGGRYPQGGGGILSMHRTHADALTKVQQERNLSIRKIVKLLAKSPDKLNAKEWVSLHDIYRHKKPTYMHGLTRSANIHLKKQMRRKNSDIAMGEQPRQRSGMLISVNGLKITASIKPQKTARCRRIQEAFGIVSTEFNFELVRDFDAEFHAGEITLIGGTSGAGKSIFLDAIRHLAQGRGRLSKMAKGIRAECKAVPNKSYIVKVHPFPRHQAPIELLSKHSLADAMKILARAGLAEAHLFVRPSYALSVGQSYRLALALALSKNPDVVLIDEFCESLDEYTTAVVCRKLRQVTQKEGLCIIVATAYTQKVMRELCPDRILVLSANGTHKWISHQRVNDSPCKI